MNPLLHEEPGATGLALVAIAAMLVGAIVTIRSGRWYGRVMLVVGAAAWPLPDHDWQGPILLVRDGHGIHLLDLLSLVAVVIAVTPWRRIRTRARSG